MSESVKLNGGEQNEKQDWECQIAYEGIHDAVIQLTCTFDKFRHLVLFGEHEGVIP